MTKLIVAFRNFAKLPHQNTVLSRCWLIIVYRRLETACRVYLQVSCILLGLRNLEDETNRLFRNVGKNLPKLNEDPEDITL